MQRILQHARTAMRAVGTRAALVHPSAISLNAAAARSHALAPSSSTFHSLSSHSIHHLSISPLIAQSTSIARGLQQRRSYTFASGDRGGFAVPQQFGQGFHPATQRKRPTHMFGMVVVPEKSVYVIERFGRYSKTLTSGVHFVLPLVERIAYVQSLKEEAMPINSQMASSKDNVLLHCDGVLYMKVLDAVKASYGVNDILFAMVQLCQTTMRAELSKLTLDEVFGEREKLNANIAKAINVTANTWGVECVRYELRDIQCDPESLRSYHDRQYTSALRAHEFSLAKLAVDNEPTIQTVILHLPATLTLTSNSQSSSSYPSLSPSPSPSLSPSHVVEIAGASPVSSLKELISECTRIPVSDMCLMSQCSARPLDDARTIRSQIGEGCAVRVMLRLRGHQSATMTSSENEQIVDDGAQPGDDELDATVNSSHST